MVNKAETDTGKSLGNSIEEFIRRSHAKYVRSKCTIHTEFLFKTPEDYNTALKEAIRNFWISYGVVVPKRVFPEIHIEFLDVDVYRLKDTWNDRNIDLKQAILAELRKGYVEFARSKGISLSAWFSVVITNVWLIENLLVIEVPCSEFSVQFPHLARILASEEYKILIGQLNRQSRL